MENFRIYGSQPFNVAVIHGGPGVRGEMAPVARELSKVNGALEPLQAADSIDGQIQELRVILEEQGRLPVTLIGHSWGAWLSFMVTAKYPAIVKKLILIGSGPFDEEYVPVMNETRAGRLTKEENLQMQLLMETLNDSNAPHKTEIFEKFGRLMSKVDSFHPIPSQNDLIELQPEIFEKVMKEALDLRKSGALLNLGRKIECPVIAIHGDYDPHPFQGVEKPLSQILKSFQLYLLKDCGHNPWEELFAKDQFFEILKREIR